MLCEKDIALALILFLGFLSQSLLNAQAPIINRFPPLYATTFMISPQNEICSRSSGLSEKQKDMCAKNPNEIVAIFEGLKMSAQECEHQFRNRRWNCSALGKKSFFSKDRAIAGTKEAAFTSAIWAAGVAHTVTRACSMGNLTTMCGCDRSKEGQQDPDGWTWGCSADIEYGINRSRTFFDAQESGKGGLVLMDKHNTEAGHKILKKLCQLECRCHGPSGSCAMQTCWNSLPSIRELGQTILVSYHYAGRVKPLHTQTHLGKRPSVLVMAHNQILKPSRSQLVYLKKSPSYCNKDKITRFPGTSGRVCVKESHGSDGCKLLCCGRGYDTKIYTKTWQCNCKFFWCCTVSCKSCRERIVEHTCK